MFGLLCIHLGRLCCPNRRYIYLQGNSGLVVSMPLKKQIGTYKETLDSIKGPSGTSTWQKVSIQFKPTEKTITTAELAVFASTADHLCKPIDCGSIELDNWSIQTTREQPSSKSYHFVQNVCDDRSFLYSSTLECLPLIKTFGFKPEGIKYPQIRNLSCPLATVQRINEEILLMSRIGGILNLPPCDIPVVQEIVLADNVILQGAGIGRTTFRFDSA